jgi:hypothetical protein
MKEFRSMERCKRGSITLTFQRHNCGQGVLSARVLLEPPHELDERARLQKDQPAIDMVVRESPKGFIAK